MRVFTRRIFWRYLQKKHVGQRPLPPGQRSLSHVSSAIAPRFAVVVPRVRGHCPMSPAPLPPGSRSLSHVSSAVAPRFAAVVPCLQRRCPQVCGRCTLLSCALIGLFWCRIVVFTRVFSVFLCKTRLTKRLLSSFFFVKRCFKTQETSNYLREKWVFVYECAYICTELCFSG